MSELGCGTQASHNILDARNITNACMGKAPVDFGNQILFCGIQHLQIANVGWIGWMIGKDAASGRFNVKDIALDRLANECKGHGSGGLFCLRCRFNFYN